MTYRKLGATGEKVSAIGLGGYHIGMPKDAEEGVRIGAPLEPAIEELHRKYCWDTTIAPRSLSGTRRRHSHAQPVSSPGKSFLG